MSDDTFHKMCLAPEIQGQWTEPKIGDRTDKGVVWNFELNNAELGDRKPYGAYVVKYDDPWARRSPDNFYILSDLIYLPSQEDLQGMLPYKEGRYYSLGWGADEYGVVRHKLNIYQWQKLQQTFYGTAKEVLIQGVMHGHGKRWDDREGWVKE